MKLHHIAASAWAFCALETELLRSSALSGPAFACDWTHRERFNMLQPLHSAACLEEALLEGGRRS